MLTKEYKTLIKNVWGSRKYGVKRLIKELPNKKWSKHGVEDFLKQLQTTGSIERAPGSRRPLAMRTAENVDAVGTWRINPRHTAPFDRSHETLKYLKQITGDNFFCSLLLWTYVNKE